jgi:O-antigen/teichoic acid export membrane protein
MGKSESYEQSFHQITKGSGIGLAGRLIEKIPVLGLHILMGRVLGPGAYGLYVLGASLTGIAQSISCLGLKSAVVRFCSMYQGGGDNARIKKTIISALAISSVSSVAAACIIYFFSALIAQRVFKKPDMGWVLRIFALSIPFYVLMEITTSFAQSLKRIDYQQGVQNIFRPLANFALVAAAFLAGFKLAGAVYGFLLSGMLSAGLGFYFLSRLFRRLRADIGSCFSDVHKLMKFSLPMMFVSMSYLLVLRIDRIMLGILRSASEVGIYNAAAAITLQLFVIHSALVSIFMPVISDVYNRGRIDEIKQLYDVVKRWSTYGTSFMAIPIIFYPNLIISLYGNKFAEGWLVLIVLPAACLAGVIAGPTGALLQMTGRQNIEFFNGFLMVGINVALNYFLIPLYGYFGAGLATFLSIVCVNVIQIGQIYRFFGFHAFDLKHVGYLIVLGVIFAAAVAVNMFGMSNLKLILSLLSLAVLVLFSLSGMKTDKVLWRTTGIKPIWRTAR